MEQLDLYLKFREVVKEQDSASIGEYFAEFRRRIFKSTGKPPSIQGELSGSFEIEGASRKLEFDSPDAPVKMADGAMNVKSKADPPRRPPSGLYLVEDKAGESFDLKQAEIYSTLAKDGKLKTSDGPYQGVIYFCEDPRHAQSVANRLAAHEYDEGIFVATFGSDGKLKFVAAASTTKKK